MRANDSKLIWETYKQDSILSEFKLPNWQKTKDVTLAGLKGAANVATGGITGEIENAAKVAAGKDADSQINALSQKDQAHDQMDQQNTQTDQDQESRLAAIEERLTALENHANAGVGEGVPGGPEKGSL
jgi:hypothetical protein